MSFDVEEYIKERRKKQAGSASTDTTDRESFDVEEYIKRRRTPEVAETISSRFKSWLSDYDSLAKDYASRYKDVDTSTYRSDSADWLSTISSRAQSNWQEALEIKDMVDQYKNHLDPEWVSSFYNALTNADKYERDMISGARKEKDYWSQWDSEDSYYDTYFGNKYAGKTYTDIQKVLETTEGKEKDWLSSNADSFMTSAEAQAEIDAINTEIKEWNSAYDFDKPFLSQALEYGFGEVAAVLGFTDSPRKAGRDQISDLEERKADLNTIKSQAERREKIGQFSSVTDENSEFYDPDFDSYVKQGEEKGLNISNKWFSKDDNGGLVIFDRDYNDAVIAARNGKVVDIGSDAHKFADYMTDEEYNTYVYHYGKYGEKKAKEYLEAIEETINARQAGEWAEGIGDNVLASYFFAAYAGLDQFGSGMQALFSGEDYIPASSAQIASGIIREDLAETGPKLPDWLGGGSLGQLGYDAINTTSNMLPSILASVGANAIAPGSGAFVGTGLMGASAAGHGKAEMLNLGYSKGQANAYGLMVGASEAGLQYLLGGITSLGGNTTGLTKLALSKVDNTFARVAISLGGNMASEGFEEGLQTVIEPWLKEIATGVDWESPDIDEVLYSSLLGALSSLGLEGGQTVAGEVAGEVQHSNDLIDSGKNILSSTNGYDALKNLANEVSSEGIVKKNEGKVGKLVSKTQTGVEAIQNKKASNRQANKTYKQIGKLSETVNSVRNEQNLTEIRSSLESKGLSKSKANKAAKLLNEALYTDGAYSEELYKSVMNDKGVWDTLRELVSSTDSTLQRRNVKHTLTSMGHKMNEDGTITLSVNAEATESGYVDESLSFVKDASKREYEFSDDGKNINKSTGNTIDIVEVASIKNGEMMLKVKDADGTESVVNAKNVEYGSGSEALVYEAVANMGLDAVSANSIVKSYNPNQNAEVFVMGVQEAYRYGRYNYSEYEMYQDGNFLTELTEEQIKRAYKLGQIRSGSDTAVAVAKLKEAIANSKGKKGEGEVHYEGDAVVIDKNNLNDRQKTGLKTMEMLSKALGIDFYVYSSYKNKDGVRVYKNAQGKEETAPNGWYESDGSIHIDLNAGNGGEGTILFTVAHELTHFIKAWSPAKFKVLANFLVEQYGKNGVAVEKLVHERMEKMKARGRNNVTYDLAFEEFVADSMQTMLTSGNVMESLAELKRKDEGLWNKIKEFFSNLVDLLKKTVKAYSGYSPDSIEGRTVAEMTDVIEQFEKLFTEGLVDASENFRAISSTEQRDNFEGAETTSILLSERDSYPYSMATVIQEYLNGIDTDILKYAEECRADKNTTYKRLKISAVGEKQATDAKRLLGIDFSEYQNSIERSAINHIEKRHGEQGLADKSMKDLNDVSRVGYILDNYDTVEVTTDADGNENFSKQFRDKNNNPAPMLKYSKKINGTYYAVIACPDAKYKKLWLVSAYIGQKNGSKVTQESDDNSPDSTPKARLASPSAAEGIIPQPFDSVKTPDENLHSDRDTDYIDAVNRGDTETAQRMVDEAAKAAGYTIKSYHGTLAKNFTEFKQDYVGSRFSYDDKGFFFIDRKSIAEDYSTSEFDRNKKGRVLEVYLKVKKPLMVDKKFLIKEGLGNLFKNDDAIGVWDTYSDYFKEEAENMGADGIILDDGMSKMTVVFDAEQIKSADPATYSDGKIIPLSERFNIKEKDFRYSDRDSESNELTDAQQEYFKDSKVRDENGNLLVMYHGTPNAGFTVFKEGTYFTEHKWYAERYKERSASSLSYKKTADNPDVYAVYLNMKKPFDTRNPEEERIFYDEYYGHYGMGTPLMESGLPDWLDGMALQEFLEEQGYDYDGLILDEGSVGGYGEEVVNRGFSYVIFDSSQVKNIDNKNPTNDPDIRYSDRDSEGNTLTKEQQEFFKDSMVRDGDGNLLVVYHGTKAEFTVFNQGNKNGWLGKGIYFAESKKYARENGKRIVSAYLNVRNPFIVNGNSPSDALSEVRAKFPQTDDFNIAEILKDNGYDGVIFTHWDKGKIISVFERDQVKSIDNKNPTSDPDIRYSDRDEFYQMSKDLREKHKVNSADVVALADSYFELYGGTMTKTQLRNKFLSMTMNLSESDYGKNQEPFNKAKKQLNELSEEIASEPKNNGEAANHLREIQRHIRKIRIKIPDASAKGDFDIVGGFEKFRRKHLGKFILAKKGIDVDSIYPELQDQFGYGWFPDDIVTVPDQLLQIAKVVDTPLSSVAEIDYDVDEATEYYKAKISKEVVELVKKGSESKVTERYINDRDTDSVSNRALLANALESTVTNEIERKTLDEYKEELGRADALEKELVEIRSKIKDLSFAKGPKDTEGLRKLREQEIKTVNRIDIRDKKLLRLEATKPLKDIIKREKDKAYKRAEQKGKEALTKYREKTAEMQRELLTRWKESRKEAVENRHKSEVRTKIKNFKKKLEGMLQHPTDRQYVPMGLANAMIEVCELINTDTSLYNKDGSINKAQERRNLTKEKLNDLKNEYENLKTNVDPMYSGEFDETVYAYLTDLQKNFGGKNLHDMTLDELREMYETLRAIEETLRDARKLIGWGDADDVYEAGDAIASEQAKITNKRKNGKRNSAQQTRDKTLNYTLSPMRNVERMSAYNEDSYFVKLFKKLEQGTRKKNKFVMESYKFFEPLTTGKNAKTYEDAIYNEFGGKKYTDINGRTFGISKMQMMQTILSYEREIANGMHHIDGSGFSFADLDMLRKGKLKDAISEEYSHRVPSAVAMVEGFKKALQGDKWAQDYMAEARKFFNEKAKDAINETMLAIKHRIIAKDKNYIPFEVDKNFVVREISAQNDIQQTINSYGMLKETKVGASQPLIITGLNNILDRHIDQVGNVHGLAIDIRNFNKVWNVRTIDSVGSDPTVKTAVQRNWGHEGVAHIEQAVQDIQGHRPNNQSALYKKVKSNYIGATFLLNLSVVTKQIGSLFASTSVLRYRSPIRMMGNLIYTMVNHKKISAEVDKYTATAWMRRQGLSDAELQTLLTEGKKSLAGKLIGKLPTALNPAKWIQGMDSAVALSLWKYAKQDTAKRTGLKGEELMKATAEFYDDVIENTQSMTDVLHRPEVQKRGDLISETLGMFKTDLYQMAGQLQATAGRYSANKSKENGKALVRTASSIVTSAVWGQLMTTLFALLRYKVNHYRDEEDEELTAKSWLKRQSFALTGDLVGYIFPLLGSEAVGLIENIVYGESEDAVDNIVLTAINDVFDTMTTIASSVKDGEMPSVADSQKFVTKALQMFGIPANNITRFINAVQLHAKDIANGAFLSFEAGVERNANHHAHRIVEAMASGKTEKAMNLYEEALEELALGKTKDGEITEDDLNDAKSSLKTALGNKYKEGEVDFETATEILSEIFGMSEDEIYWQFDKWDYAVDNGTTDGYTKYDDFFVAVETGKNLKAVIQVYLYNGVEAKTLASQITSHYKPLYKEMTNAERASIKGYLLNAYALLGYKRSDKNKDINNWLKD